MDLAIALLALVVAAAAAVRSTWSPCGLSMLSSMTPLSERSRGHRYPVTAALFLVGAVLGGLTLGLLAALGAVAVGWAGLSLTASLGAAAVVALAGAAIDAGLVGPPLPHHRRQVNELWFGRFRRWVYASGFGWQIGTGLATYIMTAAVYATVALAALTASPIVALGVGAFFGTVRGLAVLAGSRITTPERLTAFHRRFDALGQPVRWAVVAVQSAVAVVAVALAWGPFAAGALTLAAVVVSAIAVLARSGLAAERSPYRPPVSQP